MTSIILASTIDVAATAAIPFNIATYVTTCTIFSVAAEDKDWDQTKDHSPETRASAAAVCRKEHDALQACAAKLLQTEQQREKKKVSLSKDELVEKCKQEGIAYNRCAETNNLIKNKTTTEKKKEKKILDNSLTYCSVQ